jgi:peptidoglycan/LPS O-acetylase OafA/YrhL
MKTSSGNLTARRESVPQIDSDQLPMVVPKPIKASRIPALDGLRGMAVLSVLCIHYIGAQGATGGPVTTILQRALALGWSGVDLFFVLSGFLIGGILLDARGSAQYFKTFYARRFFRIIPLYYAWILLYVLLVTIAGHEVQRHSLAGRPETVGVFVYVHLVFLQNVWPITLLGLAGAWFSPLWSLAVEEQFYLISPWVIRLLSNRRLYFALSAVIVGAPFLRLGLLTVAHVSANWVYVMMPTRADSLAIGVLAALLWRSDKFKDRLQNHSRAFTVSGVILGLGALCLLVANWKWGPVSLLMQTIGYSWLAVFYAVCLLMVLIRPTGILARGMRVSWLRSLGIVSYCMYITHAAIDVVLHAAILRAPPRVSTAKGAGVTLLAALLTYVIARLSWRFFERPLLDLGHQFRY